MKIFHEILNSFLRSVEDLDNDSVFHDFSQLHSFDVTSFTRHLDIDAWSDQWDSLMSCRCHMYWVGMWWSWERLRSELVRNSLSLSSLQCLSSLWLSVVSLLFIIFFRSGNYLINLSYDVERANAFRMHCHVTEFTAVSCHIKILMSRRDSLLAFKKVYIYIYIYIYIRFFRDDN